MLADKATLPPAPPAQASRPQRQLLGKRVAVNAASLVTSIIAAGTAYTGLAMVVGIGLGTGVLYPSGVDRVPPTGSVASILLAAVALSVPAGAVACGLTAYRSTRRWLAARFVREG